MTKPPERKVLATPRFLKSKRRLPPEAQTEIDKRVEGLRENPLAGELKKGPLKDVRVVKFSAGDRQYLLAYYFRSKPNEIEMLEVGVHEKFYESLTRHIKGRLRVKD